MTKTEAKTKRCFDIISRNGIQVKFMDSNPSSEKDCDPRRVTWNHSGGVTTFLKRLDSLHAEKFFRLLLWHVVCWLFPKLTFSKNSFWDTIRVSNGLDPDWDWHSVCADLDPNCLQRLSADDKRKLLARKELIFYLDPVFSSHKINH